MALPKHIAIIMDGNGRWASRRRRPRVFGHIRGAQVAKKIVKAAVAQGVSHLTLFAFSSENWLRPTDEVNTLMKLLFRYLVRERKELNDEQVCCRIIGDLKLIPTTILEEIRKTEELTANNSKMILTFALSYGGQQEIIAASQKVASLVSEGKIGVEDINLDLFTQSLWGHYLPPADLLIRTGGEYRLSNFLMWHSAYAELFFSPTLWPEFEENEFEEAIEWFKLRERRFGRLHHSQAKQQSSWFS